MKSVFRPTTADDESSIVALATRAFGIPADTPFLAPELLRWKFWQPRDDFPDPRAYVMDRDGRIVAHAGLWPVIADGERGAHMIDWVSHPEAPGAGVSLLQKLTQRFDFIYSIGGSEMTQEILPKFGFQVVGEAHTWARPLRPFRQALHHQYKDVRLPVRFARNFWWSRSPGKANRQGWTVEPSDAGFAAERGAAFFRYLQRCPVAKCLAFEVRKNGQSVGQLALMVAQKQARLVGIWLADSTVESRRIAFELAQEAALRHSDACEMVARALSEETRSAAAAAGMRLRNRHAVLVYKKRGSKPGLPLDFQLGDNDAIFLSDRGPSFST
jgi:hypothetical protein